MKKYTQQTESNNQPPNINMASIEEAIKILEKPKMSEEEIYSVIATLSSLMNAKTFASKFVPKGTVIIGIGDDIFTKFFNESNDT